MISQFSRQLSIALADGTLRRKTLSQLPEPLAYGAIEYVEVIFLCLQTLRYVLPRRLHGEALVCVALSSLRISPGRWRGGRVEAA
jgi:hypothetical protein